MMAGKVGRRYQNPVLSPADRAWLAGLFEASGSLAVYPNGRYIRARLTISLFDASLVQRFIELMGVGCILVRQARRASSRQTRRPFTVAIGGSRSIEGFQSQVAPYLTAYSTLRFLKLWDDMEAVQCKT